MSTMYPSHAALNGDPATTAHAIADALDWIELVASDDEVKADLEVICTRCAGHLCDAEAGDTLRVLVSTALAHICDRDSVGTTAVTIAVALIDGLAGGGHTAFIDGERADGYVVGGAARPLEFDSEADVTGSAVRAWIAAVLTGHPSVSRGQAIDTIGSWVDQETGRVYFDAGTVHDDRHGAILTARSVGELAIWDIAEAREVRIY